MTAAGGACRFATCVRQREVQACRFADAGEAKSCARDAIGQGVGRGGTMREEGACNSKLEALSLSAALLAGPEYSAGRSHQPVVTTA